MRMSRDEKERSHQRIVASAAQLFRERGLEGASVGDVMAAAGMTHGGFYKHFESKDALAGKAMSLAFGEFTKPLENDAGPQAYATYRARYLSPEHVSHPGLGCPVAALGQDVGRGAAALKAEFSAGVGRIVAAIANRMKGSESARRKAAIRDFSMLVGAIVIARASDEATAEQVLDACRDGVPDAR